MAPEIYPPETTVKSTIVDYVENNPVAAVVQALAVGFAVGMIVRLIESSWEKEPKIDVNHKPTVEDAKFHLGSLLLPFVWPFWQSAKENYGKGSKTMQETVKKVKKSDLPKKGRKQLDELGKKGRKQVDEVSRRGQKKLDEAESWASRKAEFLTGLGKKTAKEVEEWVQEEAERIAELGKKTVKEVEDWVEDEAGNLAELSKKKVKDVEEWVEDEIIPAIDQGWKKLRSIFG